MKQVKMTVINKKEEVEEAKVIRVAAYCRVSTLMEEQELSYDYVASHFHGDGKSFFI